jgi:heparanase 1
LIILDIYPDNLNKAYLPMQQGITLLLINLSNSTGYNVTLQNDLNVSVDRRSSHRRKHSSFTHGLKRAVSWLGGKASGESTKRDEYHLTAKDGDHQSRTMLLNCVPLELGDDGSIPALDPVPAVADSPVYTWHRRRSRL